MDEGFILKLVMYIVPVIMSITVHEFAHAWMAYRLGDDTAASMGRMTLNPLAHIDPFGTIVLPIMCVLMGAPAFGWAKPVPFNPVRLTRSLRMKHSTMLVGLAGPVSNLLLALLMVLVGRLMGIDLNRMNDILSLRGGALDQLIWSLIQINVALAIFNLIPVPPLDGSKILFGLLPDSAYSVMETLEKYSFILFLVVIFFGARLIWVPVQFVIILMLKLMISV